MSASPRPLLCAGSPDAMRRDYEDATGPLRRLRDHMIWIARHPEVVDTHGAAGMHLVNEGLVRPMARPDERCYGFPAWLWTGDSSLAEPAKEALWRFCDSLPERERGEWCQMHTWCDSFPVGRLGIFYDWLACGELLSPAERERFREAFLSYALLHPLPRLRARLLETTPGNNQNGAMGFCCTMAGHLFGQKHGDDPRAARLLEAGLPFLERFVTHFPPGGYSGEGSSYMLGVNTILLVLGLELLEAVTGRPFFESRAAPHLATPREVMEAVVTQCGRGGLVHPWDNYGYHRAAHGYIGAYLARRTGDAARLGFQKALGALWYTDHAGWGFDSRLWTALFWPASASSPAGETLSLNEAWPTLKATLEGPARRAHVLQMWDESAWPPTRHQFNPNALVVEYDGLPLLVDGRPWEPDEDRFDDPRFRIRRADLDTEANIGIGTLAAHNAIVIDGEDWYAPRPGAAGEMLRAAFLHGANYVAADATAGYARRYDVRRVTRESLLLGDETLLVRDRIVAGTAHRYTWQAHLRPGEVAADAGGIRLQTPESVVLDLRPAGTREALRVRREGTCEEAAYDFQGADATALTALLMRSRLRVLEDCTAGWAFGRAETEEAARALAAAPMDGPAVSLADGPWYVQAEEPRPGWLVYRRTVTLGEAGASRILLRLPPAMLDYRLLVNDARLPVDLPPEAAELLPRYHDITPHVRAGANTLCLLVRTALDVSLFGEAVLYAEEAAPAEPRVAVDEEGRGVLRTGEGETRFVWRDRPEAFELGGVRGRAAAVFVRPGGCLIALGALSLEGEGRIFRADAPVDLLWDAEGLTVANPGETNSLRFRCGEGEGDLDVGGVLAVRWGRGSERFSLRISLPDREPLPPLFVNGQPVAEPQRWSRGPRIPLRTPQLVAQPSPAAEDLAALGGLCTWLREAHADTILAGIESEDWHVRLAALEAARGVGDARLAEAARRVLETELATHPTPPRRPEEDVVWYRLKAAAARVLGAAARAEDVPPLRGLLLGGDFYTARFAAAEALAAIGTEEAFAALRAVPEADEHNVRLRTTRLLEARERG